MAGRSFVAGAGALAAGTIFGLGLAVSRMIDPEKVKSFLDLGAIPTGGWDPSLAFVMAGAAAVAFCFYRFGRRSRPLAAPAFVFPEARAIDRRLVGGAALFGVGWGIAGLCPGPAIADLALAFTAALPFVLGMAAGSWATAAAARRARAPAPVAAE